MAIALNVVLFQIGWFACVLGAASHWPAVGLGVAAALVAFHLARAATPAREAVLLLAATLLGAVFETSMALSGWLRFQPGVLADIPAPCWIIALWAIFATTLNVSMRWLRTRPFQAAVLGAVGGPLAYLGGARLGALELTQAGAALAAIGIAWAIFTPLLLHLARRLDGYATP